MVRVGGKIRIASVLTMWDKSQVKGTELREQNDIGKNCLFASDSNAVRPIRRAIYGDETSRRLRFFDGNSKKKLKTLLKKKSSATRFRSSKLSRTYSRSRGRQPSMPSQHPPDQARA